MNKRQQLKKERHRGDVLRQSIRITNRYGRLKHKMAGAKEVLELNQPPTLIRPLTYEEIQHLRQISKSNVFS